MTDYILHTREDNVRTDETITINVGDRITLVGTTDQTSGFPQNVWGLYSNTTDPSGLIGNFPPELPKNNTIFLVQHNSVSKRVYSMSLNLQFLNYVTLNTPGTYTFSKGDKITNWGSWTVIVKKPTPTIPVNVSGSWKESEGSVNVNGTWKTIDNAYVNVNGAWKEI